MFLYRNAQHYKTLHVKYIFFEMPENQSVTACGLFALIDFPAPSQ